MWELDCKEGWAPKNWCFWTVVLQKTLESPLDIKEIKPVNPKGNQPWTFTERTDAEAETPVLCHLMPRANSLEKTLMLGKIEGRRRRGWQRMRWLHGITDSMDMSLTKIWKIVKNRKAWRAAVHGVEKSWNDLVTEQQPRDISCFHLYYHRVILPVELPVLGINPLFLELASCGSVLWEVEPIVLLWCIVWT